MNDGNQGNAMTEIALALAMGFFSIMVLTMVSMGAGSSAAEKSAEFAGAYLAPPPSENAAAEKPGTDDLLIFYSNGQFLSADLASVPDEKITAAKRVILAVAPDMPARQTLAVRGRISNPNLIVTIQNEAWTQRLKGE